MLNHILNGFLYRYGGSIYVSFEPFKCIIVIWLIYNYVCRIFYLDFIVLPINFFYQDYPPDPGSATESYSSSLTSEKSRIKDDNILISN